MPQMPGLMPIVMVSQPPITTGGASTSIHRVGYQRVSSLEQNLARQLDGIVLDQTCPTGCWAQTSTGRSRPRCCASCGPELRRLGLRLHAVPVGRVW